MLTASGRVGWEKLYDHVKQRIITGKLGPGERLVSSRDMQEQFDVSYYAAQTAMRRLEQEGFVIRRRGAGTFVGELNNRKVFRGISKHLRVVISIGDTTEPYLRPLVAALRAQLEALGANYSVVSKTVFLETLPLIEEEADGFVWVCANSPWKIPLPRKPGVFVAHDIQYTWPEAKGYDVITADGLQGGAVAGRYLREVGCKDVVILGAKYHPNPSSEKWCPNTNLRRRGFEEGWGEEIPDSKVLLAEDHKFTTGVQMVLRLKEMGKLPDAVLGISDDLAGGLCHGLLAHNIRPGRDIKVVGFDGQPARYHGEPLLTSVAVPLEAMGRLAAIMGLERMADPDAPARRLTLACELRKGDTA